MLILSIVVLILSYFLMFNFGNYVTGKAIINPPFSINAWSIKTSEIALQIENNEKEDYKIQNVSVEGCGEYNTPTSIESGTKVTFIISCNPSLKKGEEFKGEIIIVYRKTGSMTDLTSTGTIEGKVR